MIPHLQTLANRLEALSEYSLATTEVMTRVLAAELGVKPGAWMGAARIALTGQPASPGMFDVMVLIGRKRTIQRLRRTMGNPLKYPGGTPHADIRASFPRGGYH